MYSSVYFLACMKIYFSCLWLFAILVTVRNGKTAKWGIARLFKMMGWNWQVLRTWLTLSPCTKCHFIRGEAQGGWALPGGLVSSWLCPCSKVTLTTSQIFLKTEVIKIIIILLTGAGWWWSSNLVLLTAELMCEEELLALTAPWLLLLLLALGSVSNEPLELVRDPRLTLSLGLPSLESESKRFCACESWRVRSCQRENNYVIIIIFIINH